MEWLTSCPVLHEKWRISASVWVPLTICLGLQNIVINIIIITNITLSSKPLWSFSLETLFPMETTIRHRSLVFLLLLLITKAITCVLVPGSSCFWVLLKKPTFSKQTVEQTRLKLLCLSICCNFPEIVGLVGKLDHLGTAGKQQAYFWSLLADFFQTLVKDWKATTLVWVTFVKSFVFYNKPLHTGECLSVPRGGLNVAQPNILVTFKPRFSLSETQSFNFNHIWI